MIIRLCSPIYTYSLIHFRKIDMTTENSGVFIRFPALFKGWINAVLPHKFDYLIFFTKVSTILSFLDLLATGLVQLGMMVEITASFMIDLTPVLMFGSSICILLKVLLYGVRISSKGNCL